MIKLTINDIHLLVTKITKFSLIPLILNISHCDGVIDEKPYDYTYLIGGLTFVGLIVLIILFNRGNDPGSPPVKDTLNSVDSVINNDPIVAVDNLTSNSAGLESLINSSGEAIATTSPIISPVAVVEALITSVPIITSQVVVTQRISTANDIILLESEKLVLEAIRLSEVGNVSVSRAPLIELSGGVTHPIVECLGMLNNPFA
jgi:hypothetical protein